MQIAYQVHRMGIPILLLAFLAAPAVCQHVTFTANGNTGSGSFDNPNPVKPGDKITVTNTAAGTTVGVTPRKAVENGGDPDNPPPAIGEPFLVGAVPVNFTVPNDPALLGVTFELDPDQLSPTFDSLAGQ